MVSLLYICAKMVAERFVAEFASLAYQLRGLEYFRIKTLEGADQSFNTRVVEENPGFAIDYGFGHSPFGEGDNRRAASHGFNRRDSEVLFIRKHQGFGFCEQAPALFRGNASSERYGWAG